MQFKGSSFLVCNTNSVERVTIGMVLLFHL